MLGRCCGHFMIGRARGRIDRGERLRRVVQPMAADQHRLQQRGDGNAVSPRAGATHPPRMGSALSPRMLTARWDVNRRRGARVPWANCSGKWDGRKRYVKEALDLETLSPPHNRKANALRCN